jgi:hypothetical protein
MRHADRLKITLPSAFAFSRIAWSCLYFHDVWDELMYDGKSMLYWCKREMKWAAYWLLKTYIPAGDGKRTGAWSSKDQFVIMVCFCDLAVSLYQKLRARQCQRLHT